jgi:hypothetical protein
MAIDFHALARSSAASTNGAMVNAGRPVGRKSGSRLCTNHTFTHLMISGNAVMMFSNNFDTGSARKHCRDSGC